MKQWMIGMLSGILTAVAFSFEELGGLAFCSLILWYFILLTEDKYGKLMIGYSMGYYVFTFYWLYALVPVIPAEYGMSILILSIAVAGLSFFMGVVLWISFLPYGILRRRNGWDIFIIAFLYVTAEWIQGNLPFLKFPWVRLGLSVTSFPIIIQSASILGGLSVSLFLLSVNGILAFFLIKKRMGIKSFKDRGLQAVLLFLITDLIFGLLYWETWKKEEKAEEYEVCLVQGNHSGRSKWDNTVEQLFEDYWNLTEEYTTNTTSVVVWPETAVPIYIRKDTEKLSKLVQLCNRKGIHLIFGALSQEEDKKYNSMFLVKEEGMAREVYHKQKLVPFGEYLPLAGLLEWIVPELARDLQLQLDQTPGTRTINFQTKAGIAGGIICFESIFSDIARRAAAEGAEYLVIISNDSWFGDTQALKEHHAQAIMRAVEQKRYVIRASNTGITSIIEPNGKVVSQLPTNTRGCLQGRIRPIASRTVYSFIGDCIIFPGLFLWIYGTAKIALGKGQIKK